MAMKVRWGVRSVALGAALVVLGTGQAARAQEVEIAKLARDSAHSLATARRHDVVVFDFCGADFPAGADPMVALGEKLAADFRAALAQTISSPAAGATPLSVENRATTLERLNDMDLSAGNLRDPNTVRWVYAKTAVDAYITGTVAKAPQGYTLTVTLHALDRVSAAAGQKNGEPPAIDTLSATIPALADLNALVSDPPRDEFARLPRGSQSGYTKPECVRCVPPEYVDTAVKARAEGTVILATTIDSRGHVKDIRVKQGMPYGLTERAIESVREWKLKPAKNEKSKRVAVRQDLAVSFALGLPAGSTVTITGGDAGPAAPSTGATK